MLSSSEVKLVIMTLKIARALSGNEQFGPSIWPISVAIWAVPLLERAGP